MCYFRMYCVTQEDILLLNRFHCHMRSWIILRFNCTQPLSPTVSVFLFFIQFSFFFSINDMSRTRLPPPWGVYETEKGIERIPFLPQRNMRQYVHVHSTVHVHSLVRDPFSFDREVVWGVWTKRTGGLVCVLLLLVCFLLERPAFHAHWKLSCHS